MKDYFKAVGKIHYAPTREKLKKTRVADDNFLIIDFPNDIGVYYRHWVKKQFGLFLNPPAYGCHITVLDGRSNIADEYKHNWEKHLGRSICLYYSPEIYQHWKFWCLPVVSDDVKMIRRELGFFDEKPLHVTIGRMS